MFALIKVDVLHPTIFNTIMRFQQKDKSLIEIAKERFKNIPLNYFMGQVRCIFLSVNMGKLIQKQIQKIPYNGTITYYAIQVKLGPYILICENGKIMIPKQIEGPLYNGTIAYFAIQLKVGPN